MLSRDFVPIRLQCASVAWVDKPVCIENPIHVVEVTESRRLAGWSGCCVSFWPFCVLAVQVEDLA